MLRTIPMSYNALSHIDLKDFAATKEINNQWANLLPNPEALSYQLHYNSIAKSLTLHSPSSLLMIEAGMVAYRLARSTGYNINVIDCLLTSGQSAYPIVSALLEQDEGILGKYVASTNNMLKNTFAAKSLSLTLSGDFPDFDNQCAVFQSDITQESVADKIWHIQRSMPERTRNLFFMYYGSGNLMQPMSTFFNVYNSMNDGDYFLIIKNLYNNNEDQRLRDLTIYSKVLEDISVYANVFNPELIDQYTLVYDEQMEGIRVQIPVARPMDLQGLALEEGEMITLFRGWYPTYEDFCKMLTKTGFNLSYTAIASDGNSGVFLCQK